MSEGNRVISSHEMSRRKILADATVLLTEAMGKQTEREPLTPLEWLAVLYERMASIVRIGLGNEWRDEGKSQETTDGTS